MIHESSNEKDFEIKKVMCWASPGCHDNCRLEVTVKNGRVEKLRGDRNFPKHRMQGCGRSQKARVRFEETPKKEENRSP